METERRGSWAVPFGAVPSVAAPFVASPTPAREAMSSGVPCTEPAGRERMGAPRPVDQQVMALRPQWSHPGPRPRGGASAALTVTGTGGKWQGPRGSSLGPLA